MVAGIWSVSTQHFAEAKGMPKYWKNADSTIKQQYIKNTTPVPAQDKIFPVTIGPTKHDEQKTHYQLWLRVSR